MNNYYDILNVTPEATRAEIIETYQKLKKVFTEEQQAVYGLYNPEILAEKIQELDLAFQVLSEAAKRENYDSELLERNVKPMTSTAGIIPFGTIRKIEEEQPAKDSGSQPAPAKEKKPDIKKEKEEEKAKPFLVSEEIVSGEILARIRKERKISLDDLSEETKIKVKILEDIENDVFESLPARPYLRGFLSAVASSLKIDANKVVTDYLYLFDDWKARNRR